MFTAGWLVSESKKLNDSTNIMFERSQGWGLRDLRSKCFKKHLNRYSDL